MNNTVITVAVNGELKRETLPEGSTLPFLQARVGGYVDVVRVNDRVDMWLNDEGLILGQEDNRRAMRIVRALGTLTQPYVGGVVFAGCSPEGETVGLPEEVLREIEAAAGV